MNPDGVRQIQQVLNQRGYAAGHLDGNWNNDTTIAATHFQQAQGLEPTGTLTTNLLATVGMTGWQRGDFLGDMSANANVPGNPNPQTAGFFSSARVRDRPQARPRRVAVPGRLTRPLDEAPGKARRAHDSSS